MRREPNVTLPTPLLPSITTIGVLLAAMAAVALIEVAIPLHARGRWHRTHLGPNLALTFMLDSDEFFGRVQAARS